MFTDTLTTEVEAAQVGQDHDRRLGKQEEEDRVAFLKIRFSSTFSLFRGTFPHSPSHLLVPLRPSCPKAQLS